MKGFEDNFEEAEGAGLVLVGRLLELLITFISEPLTFQLMRDAWLHANWNTDSKTEETP